MINPDPLAARARLDAALGGVATTFRGMTAHPDDYMCDCHWGSAEELAQLKVPDIELEPDLLRRTWWGSSWSYPADVLRRILPQFASGLVSGVVEPMFDMGQPGLVFRHGKWQEWPTEQAAAIWELLHAWWAHALTDQEPVVPAYEVLAFCTEASGTLTPWLDIWATSTYPLADRRLAETATHWEWDLLSDELPWHTYYDEAEKVAELSAWLVRHAPDRLRRCGVPERQVLRIGLLALSGRERWDHPYRSREDAED